ncbi:hypothetical protein HC928_01285 [bacterium]|nr:hypothetical protein [bacterium]
MTTPSAMLAAGFGLPSEELIPDGMGQCGLCAQRGPVLALKRVLSGASADLADTFRHGGHICKACAACFAAPKLLVGNLYADETRALKPVVALASATEARPAWRDLLRGMTPGTLAPPIVTSNTKRRMWPQAVASPVGAQWRVLFVDGDNDRLLTIHHARLMDTLNHIEMLLALGYSKRAIGDTLLHGASIKSMKNADVIRRMMHLEAQTAALRHTDEFTLALFVAQKEE